MATVPERAPVGRRARVVGGRATPYVFVAPFLALFALFLVAPIVVAVVNALHSRKSSGLGFGGSEVVFVGLENFARALGDADFLMGFARVGLFALVQIPVMIGLAAALALLFDSPLVPWRRFFQFAAFLPYAVPGVIAALLWGFLYQPSVSPIVKGLHGIGLDVDLLAPGTVLWAVANVTTWSYTGINMIILYAALQSVPRELYEAARIDGAGELRIALSVKLPAIAPAVLLTGLSSVIGTLQLFNEPQVLQSITANISSDYTPNMAIYSTSTLGQDSYLGSAMAVLLGLATLIVSIAVVRLNRRTSRRATDAL